MYRFLQGSREDQISAGAGFGVQMLQTIFRVKKTVESRKATPQEEPDDLLRVQRDSVGPLDLIPDQEP